jgi:hypothetical protein
MQYLHFYSNERKCVTALFYGKGIACQALVRTVGERNGKWDNNVARSMPWW